MNIDVLFRSMKSRLLVIYTLFISAVGVIFLVTGIIAYQKTYYERAAEFISVITNQTTYNLQQNITHADFLSYSILTNSTIQRQLRSANQRNLSASRLLQIKQAIWNELVSLSYSGNGLVSLSVLSDSGYEYTFQKSYGRDINIELSREEIYEANGSLIWKMSGNGGQISAARAILDLDTMKPLGYIYMVLEDGSFAEIVQDISENCTASAFLADREGIVIMHNLAEEANNLAEEMFHSQVRAEELPEMAKEATFFYGNQMSNGWQLILAVPDSTFWKGIRSFLYLIITVTLCTIILAVVINTFVTRRIAKPTRHVMETMDQFGQGNLSVRCQVESDDEVGQIGRQFNKLADNIEELINEVYALEIINKETKIEALKMQINPHFLYNTLDTISWLGLMRGNEDVSDIAVTLADFLRSVIGRSDFTTMEEELGAIRDYLHIQSYRFGDKIETCQEVDQEALSYLVPSFILQPLVENAIIHGFEPSSRKGNLKIRVSLVKEGLYVCVEDDGVGMTEEQLLELQERMTHQDTAHSVGISNVYKRLNLYYGKESRFVITSREGCGTKVSFYIPKNGD